MTSTGDERQLLLTGASPSIQRNHTQIGVVMKTSLKILLLMFTVTLTALAGPADSSRCTLPHQDARSLDFGLSGLFNLSGYIGNSIAFKHFKTPTTAYRFTLLTDLGGKNQNGSETDHYVDDNDSLFLQNDFQNSSKAWSGQIMISAQKLCYQHPYNKLSLYYGIGPVLGFSVSRNYVTYDPSAVPENTSYTSENESNARTFYTGIVPSVGVDCFLHKNVSVFAEYYTLIKLGWTQTINTRNYVSYSNNYYHHTISKDLQGLYWDMQGYARAGVAFFFH